MQELHKENEKSVAKILKPEQFKRLKQISYQQQGGRAFTDPEVAKALRLTEEQQKTIREINEAPVAKSAQLPLPPMTSQTKRWPSCKKRWPSCKRLLPTRS